MVGCDHSCRPDDRGPEGRAPDRDDDPAAGGLTLGIVRPSCCRLTGGHVLSIMAPGLSIMSDQQSVFLGGAELYGSFSREPPASFNPLLPGIVHLPPVPAIGLPPIAPPPQLIAPPQPLPAMPTFAIKMYDTGQAAIVAILAAGLAALLLVFRAGRDGGPGAADCAARSRSKGSTGSTERS